MLHPDYRGARGSNAGDDFHELWALRQALALLEQDTPLTAIAVEGLRAEDEHGVPVDVWDGVDCTLYFGGDRASTAREIIIQQFKYSAADPTRYWTVSRLTAASNRKGDNSVIARLGKAFTQLAKLRPDLASAGALRVRLVSNQQVDSAAADALSGNVADPQRAEMRRQALVASGLSEEDFAVFARALDLSECGSGSRFDVEDRVLFTLSTLRDEDARTALDNLMRFVRRMMLPEAKEELITRERILARLGFSDPGALFPCPAAVRKVDAPIVRSTARAIAARLATGEQYLCLYGEGGCGKTTVLQELESLLPPASIIVVFDCFGGGRYLDSDAYRHRPKDAFLQLSNDLARHLRTPYLVTRSPEVDYPRVFKKRLEAAAAVTSSRADDALLVVAIDAADNSVTAAASCSPPERSFIHDFTGLGELPRNVRLVVSARSGRLALLELPRRFTAIEMGGFTREETAAFVRKRWPEAPDTWLDDFQYLSRGNPRVEAYALDYAEKIPADALAYLRPSGKSLDAIFHEQFEFAIKKGASEKQVKVFCAGLVGLPRPVPVEDLAAVTDLGGPFVLDLCADLAPGVRSEEGLISFADEDFEHFVRVAAGAELGPIQQRIADRFNQRHRTDPYSARHVAAALLAAGRGREVLSLLETDRIPVAIADPVVRRETQLQRFRIAMKVCREAGNVVDAVLTVLAGAEALRTDAAIRRTLIENPDLAAAFARDSLAQTILRDARSIESHGPVLFHLMAVDARRGEPILVRETHRQLRAWLQRRNADDEQPPARSKWPIDVRDIAAETEALLRIGGPERAVTGLRKWRPRSVALQVGSDLTRKLIITGDSQLVSACIEEAAVQSPWDLLLLTPLALATRQTDVPRLERSLARLLRRGLIRLDLLDSELRESNPTTAFLETILIACEVAIAHGGNAEHVRPVLERFASEDARRLDRVSASRAATLDLTLRAHSLLERMTGRKLTMASYLLEASPPPQGPREEDSRHRQQEASERRREIEELLGPLLDLYDARAQALLRVVPPTNVETLLRGSVERISREDYRFSRSPSGYNVRARAALSIARLMAIPGLDRAMLLDNAMSALGSRSEWLGPAELAVLSELALDRGTHERILAIATRSANAIRSARASAEDKCHALVRLSRLLADISRDDATVLFRHAIEAASEIDQGAVHEIALFAPLANRAVAVMDPVQRRATALSFGLVVEDTSIRLSGVEHFPWRQVTDALATLDMSHALAAVARWEDADLADRHDTLPRVIVTGASRRDLPASHAAALLCLLERADEEVFERITFAANTVESSLLSGLVEELAYDELLRFGRGTRAGVTAALQALMGATPEGKWLRQLAEATAFHHAAKSSGESRGIQPQLAAENERQNLVPIQRVGRFTSGPEIKSAAAAAWEASRSSKAFVSMSAILRQIGDSVAVGDREGHLEGLGTWPSADIHEDEVAKALVERIDEWRDSPSVIAWCQRRLLDIIADHLTGFSRWLVYGQSSLPDLLARTNATSAEISRALLSGIERHVDALDAPTIYAIVGVAARFLEPVDAAAIMRRYVERLYSRIPASDRGRWDASDIPATASDSVARLLFAYMGDVDVRIRWRAAHAARRLARLQDVGTLDALVALYNRVQEGTFRNPEAPFYWLAARLWLVIALDRIASELPSAVVHHSSRLIAIATSVELPHVLLRSFAKSATQELVRAGRLTLNRAERNALKRANSARLPPKPEPSNRRLADGDRSGGGEERRFHFDWIDTLPYWYEGAIRRFADVSRKEFLDVAERWIVDTWGVKNESWRWDEEKRRGRFSRRSSASMDHRHGSLPTLERFHTYLEWHAMWCATGELLRTRALARTQEGDDGFDEWLDRDRLTLAHRWLSDLRGPKPLEEPLWFPPVGNVDDWVDRVTDSDLLGEVGLGAEGPIVIGAHHETRSANFMASARVETALVSRETATALVRALQTVEDSSDYRVPPEGDELEIDSGPYRLLGWLDARASYSKIDERDPWRCGVRDVELRPGLRLSSELDLAVVYEGAPTWARRGSGSNLLRYLPWGDAPDDEDEDRRRYATDTRSSGWRLSIDRDALSAFLGRAGLDVLVEIGITRRNKGYESYSRYDQEEKEAQFDKVILLRHDGTIEGAEGRIGSWTTPRPRVGSRARGRHARPLDGTSSRGAHERRKARQNRPGKKDS